MLNEFELNLLCYLHRKKKHLKFRKDLKRLNLLNIQSHPNEKQVFRNWEYLGKVVLEYIRDIQETKNFDLFDMRDAEETRQTTLMKWILRLNSDESDELALR